MPYSLIVQPDGTHVSMYRQDGVKEREELSKSIGGDPYIEPLADDDSDRFHRGGCRDLR